MTLSSSALASDQKQLDFNFHPRSHPKSVCIVNYAREAPRALARAIIWQRAWIRPSPKSRARDLPAECTCAIAPGERHGAIVAHWMHFLMNWAPAKRWAPSVICNCDPFTPSPLQLLDPPHMAGLLTCSAWSVGKICKSSLIMVKVAQFAG